MDIRDNRLKILMEHHGEPFQILYIGVDQVTSDEFKTMCQEAIDGDNKCWIKLRDDPYIDKYKRMVIYLDDDNEKWRRYHDSKNSTK